MLTQSVVACRVWLFSPTHSWAWVLITSSGVLCLLFCRCVEIAAAVELGCNPSARDYDGRTPLHVAAVHGHANVVSALIALKASQSVREWMAGLPLGRSVWLRF